MFTYKLEKITLIIKVGLCDSNPLGVDTKKDLEKVIKEINKL